MNVANDGEPHTRSGTRNGSSTVAACEAYLGSLTKLRSSTVATIRFRLRAITKGRERMPIEAFPWATAWREHVVSQSGDSPHGIAAALQGLVKFANLRGEPLKRLEVSKPRNEGKPQLGVVDCSTLAHPDNSHCVTSYRRDCFSRP